MVMAHVGNRRQRGWGYAAIRACALVDRRWNLCASSFLWRHVEIESQRSFELLMRTLRLGGLATHQYGRSVHSISLMGVAVPPEDWAVLLRECRNVQSLHLERFCYGAQGTPTRLTTMLMHGGGAGGGAGGAGSHVNVGQIHAPMSTLAPSAAMSATTPDAPMSADAGGGIVDASKLLAKFRELVVDDSPQLPLGPIVQLLERAPKTRRLAISGCNFNEENMCTLVYYCPCLVDISLGSHMSNGQTLSGSAGGDAFANALATTCPELRAADLTGIVSMTDEGFANLIRTRGPQLHALQVRRAMQISVDALRMIATHCAHGALKRLTLANIPHMTDELLLQILGSPLVESLECLQLEALAVGDATIAQVARLGVRLRQLRLYDLDQLADLASVVGGGRHTLPKLRQLVVHGSFRLAEETPLVCVHGTLGAATGSQMASPQVVERLIYHISEMDPATALGTPDLVTPQSAFGGVRDSRSNSNSSGRFGRQLTIRTAVAGPGLHAGSSGPSSGPPRTSQPVTPNPIPWPASAAPSGSAHPSLPSAGTDQLSFAPLNNSQTSLESLGSHGSLTSSMSSLNWLPDGQPFGQHGTQQIPTSVPQQAQQTQPTHQMQQGTQNSQASFAGRSTRHSSVSTSSSRGSRWQRHQPQSSYQLSLPTAGLPPPPAPPPQCSIAAPHLGRLEIVGCNALKEETLAKLLRHWVFAKRFVYVGPSVSKEFRQQLAKAMPKCNSSVYVLSPQTPNF
ncbi:hypothetical protein HK105_208103 [Polyrhizophydium stewartii]|uniref:F-box domain-containing protein n=1 Tax=Polyrhizophydium stewartii TaxID=2732419 RepID=A0ABR4MYT7_9FUNG